MIDQAPSFQWIVPHVREIRLRRPATANRLTPDDLATLIGYLGEVEADASVHVLVLAADGPTFSAGFDLGSLTAGARGAASGESAFESFVDRLAVTRPISIAAIDGPVVGGATDLALACDLRIGSHRASLRMPAARIGVPLYGHALERYVARLGVDLAKRMVFLGETIGAEHLRARDILMELVDAGQVEARVRDIAVDLANLPAKPLAAMKRVLNAAAAGGTVPAEVRNSLHEAFDLDEIRRRVAMAKAARGG